MSENNKLTILENRTQVLSKVKDYINLYLNPAKVNFFDHSQDNFVEIKSTCEVLN